MHHSSSWVLYRYLEVQWSARWLNCAFGNAFIISCFSLKQILFIFFVYHKDAMRMKHLLNVIEGMQDKEKIRCSLLFLNFSLFIHEIKSHGYVSLLILILHCVPICNMYYDPIGVSPETPVQQNIQFLPLRYLKSGGPE